MIIILKGSQFLALQTKVSSESTAGWFESKTSIQEYRNKIQKLILNLCMNELFGTCCSVQCEQIKNQSINFTSCSDDAVRLMVLVTDRLY